MSGKKEGLTPVLEALNILREVRDKFLPIPELQAEVKELNIAIDTLEQFNGDHTKGIFNEKHLRILAWWAWFLYKIWRSGVF